MLEMSVPDMDGSHRWGQSSSAESDDIFAALTR
jgi:hypothetical protein